MVAGGSQMDHHREEPSFSRAGQLVLMVIDT
jgi:hypothetical protein